jgi:hypothetical protein
LNAITTAEWFPCCRFATARVNLTYRDPLPMILG